MYLHMWIMFVVSFHPVPRSFIRIFRNHGFSCRSTGWEIHTTREKEQSFMCKSILLFRCDWDLASLVARRKEKLIIQGKKKDQWLRHMAGIYFYDRLVQWQMPTEEVDFPEVEWSFCHVNSGRSVYELYYSSTVQYPRTSISSRVRCLAPE